MTTAPLPLDPVEHGAVILDTVNGDYEKAWIIALENHLHEPDEQDRAYWQKVADAIARMSPKTLSQLL